MSYGRNDWSGISRSLRRRAQTKRERKEAKKIVQAADIPAHQNGTHIDTYAPQPPKKTRGFSLRDKSDVIPCHNGMEDRDLVRLWMQEVSK